MSEKMTGIETATVEPEGGKLPVVPLAIGGVLVLAAAAWFLAQPGVDMGPWPSTGPIPEPSTCKVTKGAGAVPDVDAVDCHPAEMFAHELLPDEALMLPAASVSMFRSQKEGEWLALRYRGVKADQAAVDAVLAELAPQGKVATGTAESFELPGGWPVGEAWRPSWPAPEGEGTLSWVQLPEGDVSCGDDEVRGAFVFQHGDELVAAKWRGKPDCPLWKQIQLRQRTPWKRPGFGGFGGGLGGGLGGGGL
ncbi:MAG: hypothetical protein EP330_28620 [Deltaproteobacteria bacterium]|nr:MAG: hypothetical protein EP330_28620 [Deltaproteobacteria bacterium]